MALFGKKKEEKQKVTTPLKEGKKAVANKEEGKEEKKEVEKVVGFENRNLSSVIVKPLITEKAALLGEQNVYTFEVRRDATKYDVRDAVKELFKVEPKKVNIVTRKPRKFTSRMRNRKGIEPGMKKAYVYLKDGDRIDLV